MYSPLRPSSLAVGSPKKSYRLPVYLPLVALICASIVAALAFGLPLENPRSPLVARISVTLPLPELDEVREASNNEQWRETVVKPGDNLSLIFARLGLRAEDMYRLLAAGSEAKTLTRIVPGQTFRIRTDAQGELLELDYRADEIRGLRIVRAGDKFKAQPYVHEIEKRLSFGIGVIDSSLYQAALDAGLSDRLVMKLAEIFGWDIDFALDIQPGDSFIVVFEEEYFQGEKLGDGEILAAEFVNVGKTHRAVRYEHPDGGVDYYTPEGDTLRQAFLRTPVDFRRISSHFQQERWHPVLGVKRPHRGVDYSAPVGTPVQAAGDAVVDFVGWQNGYGNTVILQHQERYTTLYGHLSAFGSGLKKGERVRQGEVIGYVGQTGLATGPHLHYEFRIDGEHQNPVTVKLPGSLPLEERIKADFAAKTAGLAARLDLYRRLAANSTLQPES